MSMHHVTAIDFAFSTDSCGDDATADAFAAWADAELRRRFPGARIAVRADPRTSGPNIVNVSCDDISAEADARDVIRELWDDFGRADWPGARAVAD